MKIGQKAPDFTVADDSGKKVKLSDFKGKKVVLYFYPKDDTPGCTKEACNFRDGFAEIKKAGAVVLGVSADSVESHKKFKSKFDLNFPLLADTEKKIIEGYGVWKEKSMTRYLPAQTESFEPVRAWSSASQPVCRIPESGLRAKTPVCRPHSGRLEYCE